MLHHIERALQDCLIHGAAVAIEKPKNAAQIRSPRIPVRIASGIPWPTPAYHRVRAGAVRRQPPVATPAGGLPGKESADRHSNEFAGHRAYHRDSMQSTTPQDDEAIGLRLNEMTNTVAQEMSLKIFGGLALFRKH